MRRVALPVLLAAMVAAGPAGAQSKKRSDAAAAEALWEEGRRLRAAGKIREACPKFEESHRLDPGLGTLLNIASCHELEGKLATAWGEYKDAEQQAKRAGDRKRRKFAADHASALEPRLPYMTVRVVVPTAGLTVTRDGVELGAASLGTAIPVDPGWHTVAASAPGKLPWKEKVEAASGAKLVVLIPALDDEKPVAEAPGPAADAAAPPGADGGGMSRTTAGLAVGGVGVAALGVGIAFGLLAGSQAAVADENCPGDVCNPMGDEAVASAKVSAWVSNIGFGLGALGLLVGGYLILSDDPPPPGAPAANTSRVRVIPTLGPTGVGLIGRLAF